MTLREASCPGCGGKLVFENAATVFVVCPHCQGGSYRTDFNLEYQGKVAEVAAIPSLLKLGTRGRLGDIGWTAVGQVQLTTGAAPWFEWCLAMDGGRWAWLAEAQGELILLRAAEGVEVPPRSKLALKQEVVLGKAGRFLVTEIGNGTITAAKGELPFRLREGVEFRYADLRGDRGRFATIDYGEGEGEECDALYVGRVVEPKELGLDPSAAGEAQQVTARRLACPSCGSTIDLRDPFGAKRVGCLSCGTLLDPRKKEPRIVAAAVTLKTRPRIPLGAKGVLRGEEHEVLAWIVRSVEVAGIRYPWQEYLLRKAKGGYRWLVCSDRHWSYVAPLNPAEVRRTRSEAFYSARTFRHFQGAKARVDQVLGEVYWEVAVGEKADTDDYVDPPDMISFESSEGEIVASLGTYLFPREVADAFRLPTPLPEPAGVGAQQPNPYRPYVGRFGRAAAIVAGLVVALAIYFHGRAAATVVFDAHLRPQPTVPPGLDLRLGSPPPAPATATLVTFSDEFELEPSSANFEVRLDAPGLSNGWLGVDGSLVEVSTGEVHAFSIEADSWSGVEGGEYWREGDASAKVYLGSVPKGRYALRIESTAGGSGEFRHRVTARSQVASKFRPLLLALLILLPVLVVWCLSARFETERWAESSHAA